MSALVILIVLLLLISLLVAGWLFIEWVRWFYGKRET